MKQLAYSFDKYEHATNFRQHVLKVNYEPSGTHIHKSNRCECRKAFQKLV